MNKTISDLEGQTIRVTITPRKASAGRYPARWCDIVSGEVNDSIFALESYLPISFKTGDIVQGVVVGVKLKNDLRFQLQNIKEI
jgi:hypothetical protein